VRAWFNHFERNGCAEALVLVEIFAAQGVVALHVGRTPNGKKIAADKAGVAVTDRGFINVDIQMRTNVPHIFAIGDIVGQPMLAHKAVHEAHVAAEVIAGELQGNKELASAAFNARVIPSVAYTDPEVAWVGLTEDQAKAQGIKVKKGLFPWTASGRAIANGRDEGFTKLPCARMLSISTHSEKAMREVHIALGHVVVEALGHQHHAHHVTRKDSASILIVGWSDTKRPIGPANSIIKRHRSDHRRNHDAHVVHHAHGGDDRVQREHQVHHHDLQDDGHKRRLHRLGRRASSSPSSDWWISWCSSRSGTGRRGSGSGRAPRCPAPAP
jgi:hypothetical protein